VTEWVQTGFRSVIGFMEHLQIVTTSKYVAVANSHTLQFTTACTGSSQSAVSSSMSSASVLKFWLAGDCLTTLLTTLLTATSILNWTPDWQANSHQRPTLLQWNASRKVSRNRSQSHVTTDGQSVWMSWCQVYFGTCGQILFCLKVPVLSLWGALSDERSGLSPVSHCQQYLVHC
jgi:hypothetical protein